MFIINAERNLVAEKDVTPELRQKELLHKFVAEGDNLKVYFLSPDGKDMPVMMWDKNMVRDRDDALACVMAMITTRYLKGHESALGMLPIIEGFLLDPAMYALKVMQLGKDPKPSKPAWELSTEDERNKWVVLSILAL